MKKALAILALLMLIASAQGMSISVGSGNGVSSSTMSTDYNLDKHSLATFTGSANGGQVSGSLVASGTGRNEISVQSDNYLVSATSPDGQFSVNLNAGNGFVAGNVQVAGIQAATSPSPDLIKVTAAVTPSGSASIYSGTMLVPIQQAYSLMGGKWNPGTGASPKIQMYLKAYAVPMPGTSPLYIDGASNSANADIWAMNRAEGTWDYFTPRQLFVGTQITTSGTSDVYDGKNIIDFKSMPISAVAYTSVYMTTSTVNGWRQIVEADTTINGKYQFTVGTTGRAGKFDLESVMMNEFGHVLGLYDIYGSTQTAYPSQVMNGNLGTGILKQQYLGVGDYNGLDAIYGGNYGKI